MRTPRMIFLTILLLAAPVWAQAGKTFATPEAAVQALERAASKADDLAIKEIFGPTYLDVFEQEASQRKESYRLLSVLLLEGWSLAKTDDGSRFVRLGAEKWPLPIPVVHENGRWRFDLAQGAEELLNRRIGRNELMTIETLGQLCVAEAKYASEDRDGDGVKEYTPVFASAPGSQNGLYWPAEQDKTKSPLETALVSSKRFSEGRVEGSPWWGYYYRALPGQATGGAATLSYVKDSHQTEGYAFLAYPASYGKSGVMTFLVSQEGKVYQKDLGPDTLRQVVALEAFDPSQGWTAVDIANP